MIINELAKNKWNINKTAKNLNIHRSTLWRKMKIYKIDKL